MKYCNKCNAEFCDDISFCTNCGSKLVEKVIDAEPSKPNKPKRSGGKVLKRLIIALAAIGIVGYMLYSHLQNSTTYLVMNSQGEIFAKKGGTSDIGIDYDGYVWEITYKPSWVSISESDNSFQIHCDENTTGSDREDHITVKSGKIVQALPIGQFGTAQYLRLSERALTSDIEGGSMYINIESDGIGADVSYPEFCKIEDLTAEGFTLKVEPNEGYARTGTVRVKEDNLTSSIYIQQEGICSDCGGKGTKMCSMCSGTGSVSGWGMYYTNCYMCGGSGSLVCNTCGGDGYR